ncbi:CoA-binding protein [Salipiger sp. CCB-MM3]|uniref:CoA-binding protein n=1 Tax=Roseobacteraceae TaxID=2854170 RepID=UPI00080A9E9E|nr:MULTISPECIES: CoA-binding protein [Roseobacteraceae]ANT60723.1 CoA-binding protein [Salipiger sp. CCB-MM3]MCA0995870.1 CoA-binding protein [Alloyangia pacifica]
MSYSDAFLKDVLTRTRVIAVVGVSTNLMRPSHYVSRFLHQRGYRIIPVNPGHVGQTLFGEDVRAGLSEIDAPVDMVDIFRRHDAVPSVVGAALSHLPQLRTIWMQLGVEHAEAAAKAEAKGIDVIQNRCTKIEYERLIGASMPLADAVGG